MSATGAGDGDGEEDNAEPAVDEDVRTLKALALEKTKTRVIARKLTRSVDETRHKASVLGVTLGGGRGRKRV